MKSTSTASLTDLLTKQKPSRTSEASESSSRGGIDGETSMQAKIVLVSNRLPVRVADSSCTNPQLELDDASFLVAVHRAKPRNMWTHFIGQVPPEIAPQSDEEQEKVEKALRELNCTPVFLPESVASNFYEGMCKKTLWPLLHYVMPLEGSHRFKRTDWQSYVAANRQFVDAVVQEVDADRDLVLVNDYHLFPLPTLLRKHFNAICCGFFLHSPFPSSELLRAFPMREAILRGMLNADVVGFHVYDYARHFLSCCSRILGIQHDTRRGQIELDVLGRLVRVKILPVGVSEQLAVSLRSQLTQRTAAQLASTYANRRLFLSIDDLDGFKGLDLKLEAFERMLETTPAPGVCLLQTVNTTRTETEQIDELREAVHANADRINRRFGTPDCPAVELVERTLSSSERVALYSIASAYVLTAVRDGLNLHPYEYVYCRELVGLNSTTIVSEFVGCSPSLSGALRVNPWNIEATAQAMRKTVTMGEQERTVRHQRNYRYVSQHTCEHWSCQLINSLANVTENLPRKRNYGLGFGLNFKVVSVSEKFKRLNNEDVANAFTACGDAQRAVFLDYDGTLTSQRGCSMDIPPSTEVMNALRSLTAIDDVTVCIVSGRDRGILDEWFRDERVALAAEHGQFIKPANSTRWQRSVEMDSSWQSVAVPILESYKESTDGSSVQVKESAAAWHFDDADPDFGHWQAKELTEHLLELIGSPMEVKKSSTTVEIKPRGVSKGLAVSRLLASIEQASGPVGCVVALGDDRSDEDMFTALDDFAASPHHRTMPYTFSCTVGQKPSYASFYVDDNSEVLELLQVLSSRIRK